jgi:hypothetical protein
MTTPTLDFAPIWEVAKGVMLTGITAGVGWIATTLRTIAREQIDQKHILVGVDGKNGLKSDVRLLVRRVDAIEDRNIAIDAVNEAERQQHPSGERRIGARRLRDVVHEAQDLRAKQVTDEHTAEYEVDQ